MPSPFLLCGQRLTAGNFVILCKFFEIIQIIHVDFRKDCPRLLDSFMKKG